MRLIACVDDRMGMLFHNRRQSQDRIVRERILSKIDGKTLWMNDYSKKQFGDVPWIRSDKAFLQKAANGEYCFVETDDVLPYQKQIERIILYRWNRQYPSDTKFPIDLTKGWKLQTIEEFAGYSHEKITEETYIR